MIPQDKRILLNYISRALEIDFPGITAEEATEFISKYRAEADKASTYEERQEYLAAHMNLEIQRMMRYSYTDYPNYAQYTSNGSYITYGSTSSTIRW